MKKLTIIIGLVFAALAVSNKYNVLQVNDATAAGKDGDQVFASAFANHWSGFQVEGETLLSSQ